ncbi:hypothetical protein KM043_006040 [Ampulex compressa]|nr:hypothetical protein KM043_006040 [Ampulex compressa]
MHEVEVMAKVLDSLPPKHSTLITVWDSVPLADQKIGVLLERLIKEENRLNIEGEASSTFSAVSLSDRKSNKDKGYKKQDSRAQSKVECFYCKKKGHMAPSGELVSLGNNEQCKVTGSGTVMIDKWINGKWEEARIENVLLVPDIKRNLFSVGACAKKAYSVVFDEQHVILERQGQVQAVGTKQSNDIYRLHFRVKDHNKNEALVLSTDLRMKVTPFEAWNERKPELSRVRVFGAGAYVYIKKQFGKKMDKKAKKLILVGYQADSKNYTLWSPGTDKIIVSGDVVFIEDEEKSWTIKPETAKLQAWP